MLMKEGTGMRLKVYAAGKGTHVSVYLCIMKGINDFKLEKSGHWPLRGNIYNRTTQPTQ